MSEDIVLIFLEKAEGNAEKSGIKKAGKKQTFAQEILDYTRRAKEHEGSHD